jgi:hypothetical protein
LKSALESTSADAVENTEKAERTGQAMILRSTGSREFPSMSPKRYRISTHLPALEKEDDFRLAGGDRTRNLQ